jgi:hypothetical protein
MGATASYIPRYRVFTIAALSSIMLALSVQPAKAEPVTVTGQETRLEVNVSNFVALLSDGIFITAIPPAQLQFGSTPAAIFPVTGGLFDVENTLAAVTHAGGLHIEKSSINQSVDVTNLIVQCTSLTGCRFLGTANQALPNEVAEIVDVTTVDDEAGTITFTGRALVGAPAALVLNTLFQTDVFFAGMELGIIRGTYTYDPVTQPDAYVRPKGATPVRASLVPAYQACTLPNRQHGPPLDSGSCNPPAQTSPNLTVGSPDSNGPVANSVASARYGVLVGSPSTPGDQADVSIDVDATDIRSTGTLADYTGELQAQVSLRITDRNNSALPPIFPDDQTGTVQDTALSVTVPCTATADTTIGSHCGVSTTADAVAPGIVVEGDRAVWAFDRVRLLDGGVDGDAETAPDNMLFATQGVFVP